MVKLLAFVSIALLTVLLLGACTPPPAPTTGLPRPVPGATPTPVVASWQQEWTNTLAEAKKEGTVSVYALWGPGTRTSLTQAFKDKYGINVEFLPFARGAEIAARASAEKNAGVYMADMFGAGGPTLITSLKPIGLTASLEPLLLLPEVKDSAAWSGGKFPFQDKDKTSVAMIAAVQRYIMYNTDLVKKGEITTYKDVLKPQYKGKITISDPRVTGTGNAFLTHLANDVMDMEQARDFLRQLIQQQDVVIQRDNRINVESVARGKYAIALAPHTDALTEFIKLGAPVDLVFVKEGAFISPGAGAIAIPTKLAHANAGRAFINWLLSKEGQTLFVQSFGFPSLRADVPTEGINSIFLPQPGEKLFLTTEEYILIQDKMLGIAADVIQEASK